MYLNYKLFYLGIRVTHNFLTILCLYLKTKIISTFIYYHSNYRLLYYIDVH